MVLSYKQVHACAFECVSGCVCVHAYVHVYLCVYIHVRASNVDWWALTERPASPLSPLTPPSPVPPYREKHIKSNSPDTKVLHHTSRTHIHVGDSWSRNMNVDICLKWTRHQHFWQCVFVCICACLYYFCMFVHVFVCECVRMCVRVCIYLCLCLYVRGVCIHGCVGVSLFVHVWAFI